MFAIQLYGYHSSSFIIFMRLQIPAYHFSRFEQIMNYENELETTSSFKIGCDWKYNYQVSAYQL
jgi:hypothetical protein